MQTKFLIAYYVIILLITSAVFARGEQDYSLFLNGYKQQLSGDTIKYNSTIAGINRAMITRGLSEYGALQWKTAVVPSEIKSEDVIFSWFTGIGRQPMAGMFRLFVNGQEWFKFNFKDGSNWKKTHKNGAILIFNEYSMDENNDRFGFMRLKVPKSLLRPGQSLNLKVVGDPVNSWAWFMVFKSEMNQGIQCRYIPAVIREKNILRQQFNLDLTYFGPDTTGQVFINDEFALKVKIGFGHNRYQIATDLSDKEQELKVKLKTTSESFEKKFILKKAKKWRVNFVQHVHTDIGYTRPQTEILAEHIRFLDYVLDYCDATDTFPDEAKFRWTCEASWAVEKFLQTRPQSQINRFLHRVQEGRIEVTGMHFNFDELPDEQVLAASLTPLKIIREHGIPVKTAMQDDVNGIGWCLNEYFNDLGVKYLNMGTHGHRALIPFDKPTAFWWESPSGKRMLAFRAEHYMTGNTAFAIHTGNFERFEAAVMNYLSDLEKLNYDLDIIAIQHSGYLTDNAPPSTIASDLIRKWNRKYEYPKLKSALVSDFFEIVESKYAAQLPVYKAAWPDWWTDGFGASAREVMAMREAQTDLIAAQAGFVMAAMMDVELPNGFNERINQANQALVYYGEHTVGSSESVRDPFGKSTMEQRSLKEAYAWEGLRRARILKEEALGLLQNTINGDEKVTINIFNTLNWARSGLIKIYIDHQIISPEDNFKVLDEQDRELKLQPLESRSDGSYWALWVENVPALGHKKYQIFSDTLHKKDKESINESNKNIFNAWYILEIDYENGAIKSLFDKDLGIELIDQNAKWSFGQFIYEQLGNRNQMERFSLEDYRRTALDSVKFQGYRNGPLWQSLSFTGNSPGSIGAESCSFEIRLFNTEKRLDLLYSIIKKPVIEPEGIYIAMPFKLENGEIYCDVPGGILHAGYNQIPGSSNDWNTVQNFVSIRNSVNEIVITPHEAPLMQFGAINTGRYEKAAKPPTTHIYGWPMNNYWTTNFNADQTGYHEWHYSITSQNVKSFDLPSRIAWNSRIPFLARVLPAVKGVTQKKTVNTLSGFPENIILINAKPLSNTSALLQLRESAGLDATFDLKIIEKPINIFESNALADKAKKINRVNLNPFESKFIFISW